VIFQSAERHFLQQRVSNRSMLPSEASPHETPVKVIIELLFVVRIILERPEGVKHCIFHLTALCALQFLTANKRMCAKGVMTCNSYRVGLSYWQDGSQALFLVTF